MLRQDEQWLLKEKCNGRESDAFAADCARLKAGEPLAYVIGHIPFLGTTIALDSKPLIPRPETEYWVDTAIGVIRAATAEATESLRVLDLCAGSGAIGIAVAKAIPDITVHFSEIDATHLPTIGKNLEANNISCTRYRVIQSDLFADITEQYDFILSNPPYIDRELDRVADSVKDFEPHKALYGGADGLELITTIISQAAEHLTPQGQLWLEHEPEQAEAIVTLGAEAGFAVVSHEDQYGIIRYSVLTRV